MIDPIKQRLRFVILGFIFVVIAILIQSFRWQVLYHDQFEAESEALTRRSIPISTQRGVIYARDMTVLSIDEPYWFLYISVNNNKVDIQNFRNNQSAIIEAIYQKTGISTDELSQKLEGDLTYIPIKHEIDNDTKESLEELNLIGIHFEKEYKRIYPNGKLAANVLGFVGKDENDNDIGRYGVTGYYWGDLSGLDGYKQAEEDASGNITLKSTYNPINPKKGKDIILTIDPNIQRIVEENLKNGVIENAAKGGAAIVMNPKTGEIIAMASYPTYDPNKYTEVKDETSYQNKAVNSAYEFGSVNKVVTISTGLELGKIDENYTCNDTLGHIKILDKTIYTWDKLPDGFMDLSGILKNSNNVCVVNIALKMTAEEYYNSLTKFGLIDKVGLGLDDEVKGWCPSYTKWTQLDLATASYGHMFSATPIQIISAISTVANGGKRVQPYIIKEIIGEDEKVINSTKIISTPISEETAKKVAYIMYTSTNDGIIKNYSKFKKYKLAGKTGTAQIPLPTSEGVGYKENVMNNTYIAFGPYDDPQFIMLVWLNESQKADLANATVVPLWMQIFDSIKDYIITVE